MMKKKLVTFAVVIFVLLAGIILFVCFRLGFVMGNRQMTYREIPVNAMFKGARTLTSIDIIVDASLTGKAVLEGESNILEWAVVSDENGVLTINYKPAIILPLRPVILRIPYFCGGVLETSSSGSITMAGSDPLEGDTYNLRVNSIGSIHVKIDAKEVNVRSSSSGSIMLASSAEKAFIELSSMGSFFGFDFAIQNMRVQLSSMGHAEVNVNGELSGSTSSMGRIIYDGNPAKITVDGGKLKKK
jgi:hypothetical protein